MKTKIIMAIWIAALMSACGSGGLTPVFSVTPPPLNKAIPMVELKGEDDFAVSLKEHALQKMETDFDKMKDTCWYAYAETSSPVISSGDSVDLSSTNVQEEGVDEADSVKSSDGIVYALDQLNLHIVKVENSKKLTTLADLAIEGQPDSLYVDGSTAIVFSRISTKTATDAMTVLYGDYYSYTTKVTFIDVADPAHPKVVRESKYAGYLASSRRIGHAVHVVLTTAVNGPIQKYPEYHKQVKCDDNGKPVGDMSGWKAEVEFKKIANRTAINAYDYKSQLPATPDKAIVRYFDSPATSSTKLLTVVSIDASRAQDPDKMSVVVGAGYTVYASARSLFVADRNWRDDKTIIHRFTLSDGNTYSGTTDVDGYLINQFAMSEYKGVLRVATTSNHTAESIVTTIDTKAADMPTLGKLSGIAKGERIYAVRFVDDRAFVVTFVQIDPLFVISLRDPQNPSIMGELKVPGFSTYLHPLDESNVIGLGVGVAENSPLAAGVKLSLFNVADSGQPTETQSTVIGECGSRSDALFNHHAFTYDATQKLLALPVIVNSKDQGSDTSYCTSTDQGMAVYRVVTDKGFELLGIFKTAIEVQNYYNNSFQRGIFVNDGQGQSLLAVQTTGMSLHQLDATLTQSAAVTW